MLQDNPISNWSNIMFLDGAMHEAVPAIAACGVSPIVRIPDNQGYMVKRKFGTPSCTSPTIATKH